ncbi:MAG: erythromycin esterase family protein [Candidatus Parvarchaeota archaeon]|jgi:erythromycin esterase|nr:erythromycin esterase family protein [Candidatus Parvarchaeota archaeon]MCL5107158.1 erythromycin esterase family protein [Candidatus Parvarchaeota archaeon]
MRHTRKPSAKEIEWLRSAVIPIKSVEIRSDNSDLEYLGENIKNAKVVALGEVTHGSSEIFKMKSKIIKYLVESKKFNIFAIEANMPEAYKLNEYIIEGKGDPKELIKGMIFWTWDTEEVLDLVNWMRDYNSTHTKKVIFTGFDMQYPNSALSEVKRLLNKYNYKNLSFSLDNLENTLGKVQNTLRNGIFYKIKEGSFKRELVYIKRFGDKSIKSKSEKIWFFQCIKIIEQSVKYNQGLHGYRRNYYRDKCMAENLLWIIKTNRKSSKVIVWAHNGHIQKTGGTMGYYLSKKLKQGYLTIGFSLNTGTYTAIYWKTMKLAAYKLRPSYPGTYEYYFHLASIPIFLLDFRQVDLENKESQWLRKKHYFRVTGAGFSPSAEFFKEQLLNDFDMIIFIDKSSHSRLLHKH